MRTRHFLAPRRTGNITRSTLPSAKSFDEYVTVSPSDVAIFAVCSHVSIIPDTSEGVQEQHSSRENYWLQEIEVYLRKGHSSTSTIF
jgi:hypothetical protein